MMFKLTMTLNDNGELSINVENPGSISLYEMVGYLEKVKTEILLSTPGPNETECDNGSALDSTSGPE